jgi:hypothetical protein
MFLGRRIVCITEEEYDKQMNKYYLDEKIKRELEHFNYIHSKEYIKKRMNEKEMDEEHEEHKEYLVLLKERKSLKELRKCYTINYKKKHGQKYPFSSNDLYVIKQMYENLNYQENNWEIIEDKIKNDLCYYHRILSDTYIFSLYKRDRWLILSVKDGILDAEIKLFDRT